MLPVYNETTIDLETAKKRIITLLKGGWCKGDLGKDKDGIVTNMKQIVKNHPDICAVCLAGAVYRANIDDILERKIGVFFKLELKKHGEPDCLIGDYNDMQDSVESIIELVQKIQI